MIIFIEKNAVIQTFYFGSKKSDNQLKIYNKAEELKANGILFDYDFWRVEAEIKKIDGEKPYLNEIDKITSFNVLNGWIIMIHLVLNLTEILHIICLFIMLVHMA